ESSPDSLTEGLGAPSSMSPGIKKSDPGERSCPAGFFQPLSDITESVSGEKEGTVMSQPIQIRNVVFIAAALACLALSANVRAVNPPPDGGYPNYNTAEGDDALFSLTSGGANTSVGIQALYSLTTGDRNTAVGAVA